MLVVGSQCDPMGLELSMLPGAAHDLGAVLTSELGRCSSALPTGPVLVDPSARQLDDALVEAMRAAHEQRATLVLAFIGHGGFEDDDFYLMAKDSAVPDSREAVLVGQRLKELLRRYSALDGLVLLIDACHSGLAAEAAGREWLQTMRRSRRRLELLTATDEGPAYGACATRTLTRLILAGSPQLGERLHFTEVKGYLDQHCGSQVAIHMAYDGSREVLISDPAAWIAYNPAWSATPLAGTAQQATIEQLTTFYEPTEAFTALRHLVAADADCVVLEGPPGSGKSAAAAELAHPRTAATVHAVLFASGTETLEQLALELARQLRGRLPEFAEACDRYWDSGLRDLWPRASALEIHVFGPLRHVEQPVRLVVDGIDAFEEAAAGQLLTALRERPGHVRLVVTGSQAATAFPAARRITFGSASDDEIVRYADRRGVDASTLTALSKGSWRAANQFAEGLLLTASLSAAQAPGEGYERQLRRAGLRHDHRVAAVLSVLLAAGAGTLVPIDLLRVAAKIVEVAELRDVLFRLGALVVRGRPGEGDEQVGLSGSDVADYLGGAGIDAVAGHHALADAIPHVPTATAYGIAARHRHLWASGRYEDAFSWVEQAESVVPDENRIRWATLAGWAVPGALRRRAEARAATWTAKAGDPAAALPIFRALLAESPGGEVETFSLHNNVAYWTGESGDWAQAHLLAERLVAECETTLGPHHPETLAARHLYALTFAKLGQVDEGLRRFREVLQLREQVIGPAHIDTLRSRHNLLYWEAENAYPPPVSQRWSHLVEDLVSSMGPDHDETLTARYHAAMFGAKRGEVEAALTEFRALLPEVERVLGSWHPQLRKINEQIVFWTSHRG